MKFYLSQRSGNSTLGSHLKVHVLSLSAGSAARKDAGDTAFKLPNLVPFLWTSEQ